MTHWRDPRITEEVISTYRMGWLILTCCLLTAAMIMGVAACL